MSFWQKFVASLMRVRVSSRAVEACHNRQIVGKIPIRDSKECKQQAIEVD